MAGGLKTDHFSAPTESILDDVVHEEEWSLSQKFSYLWPKAIITKTNKEDIYVYRELIPHL